MDKFKDFLVKQNLAKNTISAYLTAVSGFKEHYEEVKRYVNSMSEAEVRQALISAMLELEERNWYW